MPEKAVSSKTRWIADSRRSFFILRTPVLPFDVVEEWGRDLEAPGLVRQLGNAQPELTPELATALARDRERVRRSILKIVDSAPVREAMFIASPSLLERLPAWANAPESEAGQRVEPPLVRYVTRMSARAMVFGFFAGTTVGRLDVRSNFEALAAPWARRTVVDYWALVRCSEELQAHPAVRRAARFRTNPTCFGHGPQVRFVAMVRSGDGYRSDTVSLDRDEYLDTVGARARQGASFAELSAGVVGLGVAEGDAAEYVDSLVEQGFLVGELLPSPTAEDPTRDFTDKLAAMEPTRELAGRIARASDALAALDARGLGHAPSDYVEALAPLEGVPGVTDRARAFRARLVRTERELALDTAVAHDVVRVIEFLRKCPMPPRSPRLEDFARRFEQRYEHREVPLLEALDADVGLGFGAAAQDAPLLDEIGIEAATGDAYPTQPWGVWERFLLDKLSAALARGDERVELVDDDVARFRHVPARDLPAVLDVSLVLGRDVSASDAPVRALFFQRAHGPRVGAITSRNTDDPKVRALLMQALAADASSQPGAVLAEIVHSPRVPVANALIHPSLREYEIPCPDPSALPEERVLPLSDLLVSVRSGRIELRSRRLQRRIDPRLTTAHNYRDYPFPPYAFLAELQAYERAVTVEFAWGALADAPRLPRVVYRGVVLKRASWRLRASDLAPLRATSSDARYLAAQVLRRARRLPRYIVTFEADRELVVDLDCTVSIDAFADTLRDEKDMVVEELFPAPEQLLASPDGKRFVNDAVLTLVRQSAAAPSDDVSPRPVMDEASGQRTFFPGSEWLFVKLYGGAETLPTIVNEILAPVARERRAASGEPWFYLYYADPDPHVRVRFRGDDVVAPILSALQRAIAQSPAGALVRKLQIDTYVREVERYGGWRGIELAERLFAEDSDAALAIYGLGLSSDDLAVASLMGVHALFRDLGFSLAAERAIAEAMREGLLGEHKVATGTPTPMPGVEPALAQRFRARRQSVEGAIAALVGDSDATRDTPWKAVRAVYESRARALAPIVAELRALEAAGGLTLSLDQLARSYVHLSILRTMHVANRTHELVFVDFLIRILKGLAARAR